MSRRHHVGLAVVTCAVLALLYVPIATVILNAFNRDVTLSSWGGGTTRWFSEAYHDGDVRTTLSASVQIALAVAALSVVIAIAATLYWRAAGPRGRRILDASTYMRIAMPEVVIALGLFILFRRFGYTFGKMTVIAGHTVFTSAFATIVLQARAATLDRTIEDAAADLGAPPRRVFLRVILPQLMPAVVVAALLAFTFSFDDVVTSLFLSGSGVVTLPMLIFGIVRFHINPAVNAIGSGVMMVTVLTLVLSIVVLSAGGGSRRVLAAISRDGGAV